jgi:hypothetical protein
MTVETGAKTMAAKKAAPEQSRYPPEAVDVGASEMIIERIAAALLTGDA